MLTDIQCRKAIAKERPYKLPDGKGLHLYVTPTGFKSWRFKYRIGKIEKQIVIGPYPDVTIVAARQERDRFREQLRTNLDPTVVRKQEQAAARLEAINTFEKISKLWHKLQLPRWSERHAVKVMESLELYAFPKLGKLPLSGITMEFNDKGRCEVGCQGR